MGMICNFLLKFAEEKINKETIEKIRQEFNIPNKGFKPEINYPDNEWERLLDTIAETLRIDNDTAEQMFAEYAFNLMTIQYKSLFERTSGALDFLRKVPIILSNLPALAGVSAKKKIKIVSDKNNTIIYHYSSQNHLCTFLKSMIKQVFKFYNESCSIKGTQCMKDGKDYCEIIITAN